MELREQSNRAHNTRTAEYLLSNPFLPDHGEEGLAASGCSCEDHGEDGQAHPALRDPAGRFVMARIAGSGLSAAAFMWPALAAMSASEAASAVARQFVELALGRPEAEDRDEPLWTTANRVALELPSVRLRDFSRAWNGPPALICAPFALHHANIVDFAGGHSLVEALISSGQHRLWVTDWRSANADMQFFSIDTYLADLNILVDQLGGRADLIGLCQGGWLALIYAARFPTKVRNLVLAAAPVDVQAADSPLSRTAQETPLATFKELVALGQGRMLGRHALQVWGSTSLETDAIREALQSVEPVGSPGLRALEARFRDWYEATVDLPGTYYLQAVKCLFKQNQLARGCFLALGQRVELAHVRCPLFLLAARDDDLVAPAQIFAVEHLVKTPAHHVRKITAPCGHLGLFMGRTTLRDAWPRIARWLALPDDCSTRISPHPAGTRASSRYVG